MSLRRRLVILLLCASAVVWVAASLVAFVEIRRGLDGLFDAELSGAARLLLAQAGHELREADDEEKEPDLEDELELELEDDGAQGLVFQFWSASGRLLYRSSAGVPLVPLSPVDEGFVTQRVGQVEWRVFSQWAAQRAVQVQVAQPTQVRSSLVARLLWRLLAPVLLGLPVLALLIWVAVTRGLQPIRRLAREVSQRGPTNLRALATQAPSELEPMVTQLNALLAALDGALAREKRFTADAAHELRTPLAALKTQAEVALGARDAGERQRALEQIGVGVDRAAHLVQQLLTLARLEPGSGLDGVAAVELRDVVREVLAELGTSILAREVDVETAGLGSAVVRGDAVLLATMVRNLLDNAIRYGPQRGRLVVRTEAHDGRASLEIVDEGPGLTSDARSRVFERFYRVPGSRASGSGLGLSIVERVVTLHGGTIVLGDGPDGRGLAVTVSLPT